MFQVPRSEWWQAKKRKRNKKQGPLLRVYLEDKNRSIFNFNKNGKNWKKGRTVSLRSSVVFVPLLCATMFCLFCEKCCLDHIGLSKYDIWVGKLSQMKR